MKIKVISDLHTEWFKFNKFEKTIERVIPSTPEDKDTILICSGDVGTYKNYPSTYKPFFNIMSKRFKHVVVCPGNHSFYNSGWWGKEKEFWTDKKIPKNIHYLDNDTFVFNDIAIIGSCLWTNFNDEDPLAMFHAKRGMTDFDCIKKRDYEICSTYGQVISSNKVSPEDTVQRFYESKAYIQMMLDIHKEKKCIVVTHHAPSSMSVGEVFRGDLLNYAYYTALEEFILDRPQIKIWSHGHMHSSFDYELGSTRVICNPFGYLNNNVNKNFNHNLIVEI